MSSRSRSGYSAPSNSLNGSPESGSDGKDGSLGQESLECTIQVRARPTRPCLEVVYTGPPVPPRKLLSEAVLLMTPLWRAIMWGNTAQVSRNGPVRLIAMVLFDAILPLFPSMPLNARTSKR